MARSGQEARSLVLGASGKVARMVRAVWKARPPCGHSFVPVMRVSQHPGAALVGPGGEALTDLAPARAIIALWGVVPGPDADLADNTRLALRAMKIAMESGADRVLHCSSAAVYGPSEHPLREDAPLDPPSAYGAAKRAMEEALSDWQRAHPDGPRSVCLRIGSVAGAESLFTAMRSSETVVLDKFANGCGPERSYIAPSDLAEVLATLALAPREELPEVINVGAPVPTAMEAIARAAGRRVVWRSAPATALQRVVLDTSRLSALCPLDPVAADPWHLVSDWMTWRSAE